jgi:ABC-type amino acid transport substrate-binding protein
VAFTSLLLTDRETDEIVAAEPIAWWPITFIVTAASPVLSADDISGRVGATAGSSADRWARGDLGAAASDVPLPPPGISLVRTDSDLACLDALVAGDLDACLTTAVVPADLAARPQVRALERSPVVDPRGFAWPRSGPDSAALAAELRRVLGELREDGTLQELSLRRFGTDITASPTQ